MKRTILFLCIIGLLGIGVITQPRASPPQIEPTASIKTTELSAEKKEKLPQVEPIVPAPTTTPPQAEITAVALVAAPVEQEITATQPTEKSVSYVPPVQNAQRATKPNEITPPKTSAPKMGDKRTVDGENQVYILGFDWIKDEGGDSHGETSDGKGSMDIMVGDVARVKTPTPHIPAPGEIATELTPTPTKNSTPPDYKPNNPVPENPRQSRLDPAHGDWNKIIGH